MLHPAAAREGQSSIALGASRIGAGQLSALQSAWRAGRLVPFLGAGISADYGLPNWNALVLQLLFELEDDRYLSQYPPEYRRALAAWATGYFDYNLVILARAIKQRILDGAAARGIKSPADQEIDFLELLRRKMYEGETTPAREHTTLHAVAELIQRGNIETVVTFNFDDLLERELDRLSVKYHSVYAGSRLTGQGVAVIHPHGFLPRTGSLAGHSVVFTEDEYHRLSNEVFHWAHMEVLNGLRKNTAFFVGLSMSDPNLRRLLDASYDPRTPAHWAIQRQPAIGDGDRPAAEADIHRRATEYAARLGRPIDVRPPSIETAVPNALRFATKFNDSLFQSMGVKTIWISRFEDLPLLVERIGVPRERKPQPPAPVSATPPAMTPVEPPAKRRTKPRVKPPGMVPMRPPGMAPAPPKPPAPAAGAEPDDTLDLDVELGLPVEEASAPHMQPASALPTDPEDPQLGMWGGQAERNGRALRAEVTPLGASWFSVELRVVSTDPRRPLAGEVVFHLHDSFPEPDRKVEVRGGQAQLDLEAYGAFTVGAEADGGETTLELNLATLPKAPKAFREN